MKRLEELFKKQHSHVLNIYCTAGYPQLDSTMQVMKALQVNGADIIELGIPYSDPLADGPVIQQSGQIALGNGMTIKKLFEQLKDFRNEINIPVILMGYLNPVLQYGFKKFCMDASAIGIDGLILPDMPEHEFEKEYGAIMSKYNLDFIFLVTPETSAERVKKLDALSSGFLYAVSSSSTTGSEKNMDEVSTYLQRLKSYGLKNPILAGFGIKDKATFDAVCKHVNGGIIGSAYIKGLEGAMDIEAATGKFLRPIISNNN